MLCGSGRSLSMLLPLCGRYENEYGLLLVGTNIIVTPVPLLFGILIPMGCNTCLYFTLCCRRSKRHLDEVQQVDLSPGKKKYKLQDSENGTGHNMASRVLEVMTANDALQVEDMSDADPGVTSQEMTIAEAKQLMAAQERSNAELQRKLSEAERKATRLESILQREQKKMKQLQVVSRRSFGSASAEASSEAKSLEQDDLSKLGATPSTPVPRLALDGVLETSQLRPAQRRRVRGRPRIGELAAAKEKAQNNATGIAGGISVQAGETKTPSGTAQETRQRVAI